MRFTTFVQAGEPRLGLVDGDAVIDRNAAQPRVPPGLRAGDTIDIEGTGILCNPIRDEA